MASKSNPVDELPNLLRSIISDPDNDTIRISYAGRLEVSGFRERASLIRLQIAVARLPSVNHPDWLRLASEAKKLEIEMGSEWTPAWYKSEGIRDVQFQRGFIECATTPASTLMQPRTRTELFTSAPVRHLNIVGLEGDSDLTFILERFLSDGVSRRILSLDLSGQNLTDMSIGNLGQYGLHNLRWISLAHNNIGESGVRALADATGAWSGLGNLLYVNLEGNPFDPTDQVDEDQGIVVRHRSPEIQAYFPSVGWLKRKVEHGRPVTVNRFSSSSSSGLANTARAAIAQ